MKLGLSSSRIAPGRGCQTCSRIYEQQISTKVSGPADSIRIERGRGQRHFRPVTAGWEI